MYIGFVLVSEPRAHAEGLAQDSFNLLHGVQVEVALRGHIPLQDKCKHDI